MALQWPNDVPYEQNAEGAVRPQAYRAPSSSSVEAGPAIIRRRPGPRSMTIPWKSLPLTEAQWDRLNTFFLVDLLEGTQTFDMPVFKPGSGYVVRNCQLEGGLWNTDQSSYPIIYATFSLVIFNP